MDLGRFWQLFLLVGPFLWLFLMLRTLWPALRRPSESRPLLFLFVLSSVAIAVSYAAGLMYGRTSNLAVVEHWRWWVVRVPPPATRWGPAAAPARASARSAAGAASPRRGTGGGGRAVVRRAAVARPSRPPPLVARRALAALAACALASCAHPPAPPAEAPAPPPTTRYRPEDVPRELLPAVARADAAIRTLRERLAATVAAQVASQGPRRAIPVLREAAPALAAAVSAQTGVDVGRTSARPRSEAGVPRAWAAPLVAEAEGRKAAEVAAAVVDLGDRVGLLRPIAVQASCLACHGGPERVAPEVRAAIEEAYPKDRALGLAEGDLVGFFWAEAKK